MAPKNSWIGPGEPPDDKTPSGTRATTDVLSLSLVRGSASSQNVTSLIAVTGFGKVVRIDVDIPDSNGSNSSSAGGGDGLAFSSSARRRPTPAGGGGGTKRSGGEIVTTLFYYHYGPLWALAVQRNGGDYFATGGDDKWLSVWDGKYRKLISRFKTPAPIRCLDLDKNNFIAVGNAGGSFAVYRLTDAERSQPRVTSSTAFQRAGSTAPNYTLVLLGKRKDCIEDISDVKFSPNSKMLAVGSHDNFIDIYATRLTTKEEQVLMMLYVCMYVSCCMVDSDSCYIIIVGLTMSLSVSSFNRLSGGRFM
jgi:WD40 repeat protein